MSTGYTSFIEEGKIDNARDFLRLCLRNFGVAIDYRDEPLSLEVLKFDKSRNEIIKRYEGLIKDNEREKEELFSKSFEEIKAERIEKIESGILRDKEYIKQYSELKEVYEKIKKDIEGWECEEEFQNIKDFALGQISMSDYDWYIEYYTDDLKKCEDMLADIDNAVKDYIDKEIKIINGCIEDYKKEIEKQRNIVDGREEFYNRFIESVSKI